MKPSPNFIKPVLRNPWPVCIVLFFTTAVIGLIAFIWFCNRHPADLVSADYYEQELRYQGQLEQMQNAEKNAPGANVTYAAKTKSIVVSLPGAAAGPDSSGFVQLYRPSSVRQDRHFKLQLDSAGLQRIDAAALSPGLWKIRISWTVGGNGYFIDRKVVIDSQPT